jgi:hypothetical protein
MPRPLAALALLLVPAFAHAQAREVPARVESTLATGGPQIRQFAFDGNADTFFASEKNATKADSLAVVFDEPVAVKAITVTTGRPKGGEELADGVLEVPADGKTFEKQAAFQKGTARGDARGEVQGGTVEGHHRQGA